MNGLASTTGNGVHGVERKGKGRASLVEEERSESSVPSKIYIDHPSPRSETASTRLSGLFGSMIAIFPQKLQSRLGAMSASDWLASSLAIPLPIICLAIAFISIRRRLVRKRGTDAPSVVAGTATLATQAIDDVRARLMRARGQGIRQWVRYWLRWWAGKFSGVWKLGTTITYV